MGRCEKRTTTRWVVVLFWQRRKDSNLGNDGVRVRCLTAWRRRYAAYLVALCGAVYIIAENEGNVKPFFNFFAKKMRFWNFSLFV